MLKEEQKRSFFGKGTEEIRGKTWDWENFETTEGFPVSDKLLDWVVGQDRVLKEVSLALDEWIYKLQWLQKKRWYKPWLKPESEKPVLNKVLTPGPYLLLLGEPGTGKSLIGKAMAEYLTKVYKEKRIKTFDILCWKNRILPSMPRISIHPAGTAKEIIKRKSSREVKKTFLQKWGSRILMGILGGFGGILLGIGISNIIRMSPIFGLYAAVLENAILISIGGSMMFFTFFIWQISRMFSGNFNSQGVNVGGASRTDVPKLLVDNSHKTANFVDATGHTSAQLFGCMDEKSRIFTTKGFKSYHDIEKGDMIFTLGKDGQWEIQPVKQIFVYDYVGEMKLLEERKGINFCITPNHRLLYRPRDSYDKIKLPLRFGTIEDATQKSRFFIPQSGTWNELDTSEYNEDFLRLLGWFISEGYYLPHRNYVAISQEKYKTKVETLLKNLNIKHFWNGTECIITDPKTVNLLMECGRYSHERFIPRKYLNLSRHKLQYLFETLMLGDGNKRGSAYYTTSPRLRDNLIELGLKLGFSVSFSEDSRTNNGKWRIGHRINFSKKAGYVKSSKIKTIQYKGKVWCVSVKNQNFVMEREGKLSVTGNSIAWDPYQTGGLGTPEHQRVTAGDVHRANLGILYIDEIKNLHPQEAITLLSVMEDGALPVTMRSQWHGADTAAMAVSTEPIPALFFLLGAGNYDSVSQIHPALMDRLIGYGRVVRMNNDMPNTVVNRRKYVQFIAQEVSRFHLPPFTRDACIEIVEEGRRRSNKRDALTTKFRPLISVIKTAGTLAQNRKSPVVDVEDVVTALEEHCKTIQKQLLEHQMQEKGKLLEIKPTGTKLGTIYGLAVVSDQFSGEMTGSVLRVKGQMVKKSKKKNLTGYYRVTGVAKEAKWIGDSAEKVRSVILHKYGVDIAQEYFTHIDFSQAYGIDGPSAGVTMALLLCSLLEGKPIRQDVAVTGEINISSEDEIEITAVGGVHEKIKAAEAWGFKKVVIPLKNLKHSIKESDYKIKVVGARTLDEYLKEVLAE